MAKSFLSIVLFYMSDHSKCNFISNLFITSLSSFTIVVKNLITLMCTKIKRECKRI